MPRQGIAAFIDLTSGNTAQREIPLSMREAYLGGRGLNAVLLHGHAPPSADPEDPARLLLIGAGLLAGMPAPAGAGAVCVGGMLPFSCLSGSLALGGFFGAEMRFAGFDHLVIRGRAESPAYLWVHDGEIELGAADAFRSADAAAAQSIMKDILDEEDAQVMTADAPAGDAARTAALRVGGMYCRHASELGALMAVKNLKAIAIRGTLPLEVRDPVRALQHLRQLLDLAPLPTGPGRCGSREGGGTSAAESDFLSHCRLLEHLCRCGEADRLDDVIPAAVAAIWQDECLGAVLDALGLERPAGHLLSVSLPVWDLYSLLVEAATGLRLTPEDLLRAGERICAREWLCNIRAGFSWGEGGPYRQGRPFLAEPSLCGRHVMDAYGRLRGWDKTGVPLPETMCRLGLGAGDFDTGWSGAWPES